MTIAEILALPNGSKVDPFHATIQFVNPRKSANAPQNLKIQDDTGSVKLVLWKRPDVYDSMKGKPVLIAGGTTKDNDYNGKVTREVHLNTDGSFDAQGSGSPQPAVTAPAASNGNSNVSHGSSNSQKPVFGGTAGCAVKLAVDIQLELLRKGILDSDHFGSPEFSQAVYRQASDLVRVMQTIEEGKLAPPAKERAALVAMENDSAVRQARELFTEAGEGE